MKKLLIATNNKNKVAEIKEILKNQEIEVVSLADCNINLEVVEDGTTFLQNADKKAYEISQYLADNNILDVDFVLADDSGLCVDALNGEPNVYSARYSGVHGDDKANNEKLLKNLESVPMEKRTAQMISTMVLYHLEKNNICVKARQFNATGIVEGFIATEERGNNGFAYDTLFIEKETNKTFAEMTTEEKNSISHRKKALNRIACLIDNILNGNFNRVFYI
ncbi:RdgB/HAM1 family non-canonical purine NTP pyrophosphatase [Clostridium perfringens]|nr:RdgB/HAM1 family non-canonical purine NTP pyrophosphatase [Clostridium perfringens]